MSKKAKKNITIFFIAIILIMVVFYAIPTQIGTAQLVKEGTISGCMFLTGIGF